MALAFDNPKQPEIVAQSTPAQIGTVDPIPERYQTGLKLYLENCSSCHIALPPEVMPSDTWRTLLLEPEQHYGQKLEPIPRPFIFVVWDYVRTFSRPLNKEEQTPFRLSESRYFKAFHPQVDLPQSLNSRTCVSCHPGAAEYDFRRLTPEQENSPSGN